MSHMGRWSKLTLLDVISRLVSGHPIETAEREKLGKLMQLSGFRVTAGGYLLGRLTVHGSRSSDVVLLVPALDGRFRIAVKATDAAIGRDILRTGHYEPHVVAFYARTVKAGMTVVDVGANIGFHALHAADLVGPTGRVIAVEPDPGNVSLLRLSLRVRDGGAPVEVIEGALSESDGSIILSDLGNGPDGGARFTHPDRRVLDGLVHGPDPQFRSVTALRWDSRYLDTRIDFVKIDVEGFEPHVVKGMEGSIDRHRPIVVTEFAPDNLASLGGIRPFEYVEWFLRKSYSCSIIEADGATTPATEGAIESRLVGRHHLDLALIPGAIAKG